MKKPKFNIIDILIILVIVAIAAAGFYILSNKTDIVVRSDSAEVLFTIEETDVDPERMAYYQENAKAGDVVSVGIKEKISGVIESIDIAPAVIVYENPVTGERELKDEINNYDINITIRATVEENDRDFLIGTAKLKIGNKQNFVGKGYSGYGTVIGLKRAEVNNND